MYGHGCNIGTERFGHGYVVLTIITWLQGKVSLFMMQKYCILYVCHCVCVCVCMCVCVRARVCVCVCHLLIPDEALTGETSNKLLIIFLSPVCVSIRNIPKFFADRSSSSFVGNFLHMSSVHK